MLHWQILSNFLIKTGSWTLSPNCCGWRDIEELDRCFIFVSAEWLVSAVWSAKRCSQALRSDESGPCAHLTWLASQSILPYRASPIIRLCLLSSTCIMNHHLFCTCLDNLAFGFEFNTHHLPMKQNTSLFWWFINGSPNQGKTLSHVCH